jgi:hypothetical protein
VYKPTPAVLVLDGSVERALRAIAIGPENWMFVGSDTDGHTASALSGVIASCERPRRLTLLCHRVDGTIMDSGTSGWQWQWTCWQLTWRCYGRRPG